MDIDEITHHWPLTSVVVDRVHQTSKSRRAISMTAAEGNFVAKVEDHPRNFEFARRPCNLLSFLQLHQFAHAPALLRTRNGDGLLYSSQRSIIVMEHIPENDLEESTSTWSSLGKAASLLNTIRDYPHEYGVPARDALRELAERAQSHPEKSEFLRLLLELEPLLHSPSKALIHGEINLANAARRKDGTVVLLDWDEAGTGSPMIEIGYPLLTQFLTEDLQLRTDNARAFFTAYHNGATPDNKAQDQIWRSALFHALRYCGYGNREKRWRRIQYAVENKTRILNEIFGVQ